MTFLDSSAIIDMLAGVDDVVTYVEARGEPYFTSTICVYEVLAGKLGAGRRTSLLRVRISAASGPST